MPVPFGLSAADYDALCFTLHWVLPKHTQVFAFGSRVKNPAGHKPFADLDLAITLPNGTLMGLDMLLTLKQRLTDAPLTIRVDIADYNTLTADFKAEIDAYKQPFLWQKT